MASTLVETTTSITTEQELIDRLMALSKADPKAVYQVNVTWGTARFYKSRNKSSVEVDSPATRQMLQIMKCIGYQNGKKVTGTKGWTRRRKEQEQRDLMSSTR